MTVERVGEKSFASSVSRGRRGRLDVTERTGGVNGPVGKDAVVIIVDLDGKARES
jgi:hypothetical protein